MTTIIVFGSDDEVLDIIGPFSDRDKALEWINESKKKEVLAKEHTQLILDMTAPQQFISMRNWQENN